MQQSKPLQYDTFINLGWEHAHQYYWSVPQRLLHFIIAVAILSCTLPYLGIQHGPMAQHSSLWPDHFTWGRKRFSFKFFLQCRIGKGGNTVTVRAAKMECLVDTKRTMPGGREMHKEDIFTALKLTSFTNSPFTLISYKCGKRSTIRWQHLLTCIDRPEVQRYPVWTATAQSIS